MNEKRKTARWRRRRIIYNNDGDEVFGAPPEFEDSHDSTEALMTRTNGELIDDFLDARTTPVVGTQVDSIWYCSCSAGLTFSHRTKLGGFYGKGFTQQLIDTYDRDSLNIQVDFAHERGIESFWSLRMNDVHDSTPEGTRRFTYGLAPFKRNHPEYMMGVPDDWGEYPKGPKHYWSALDFSYPEVRDHYFHLIQEVCETYDVDGVELDFLRHPCYFTPTLNGLPVEEQHLDIMTNFVCRIRKMAMNMGQRRGRPILLAVRTPFTLSDAQFIGLDLEKWLKTDLIDILIAGGLSESPITDSFKQIVDLGHQYNVPVYPCIKWGFWNYWAFLDLGSEKHRENGSWTKTLMNEEARRRNIPPFNVTLNAWEGTLATWRGAAMNLFNAGADGIYTFNAFFSNHDMWQDIGDPKTMAGKDKIFGVDRFPGSSSFNGVNELELNEGHPVIVVLQVGEDIKPAGPSVLRFRLHLWDLTENDNISVKLNNESLNDLKLIGPRQTPLKGYWLECLLNPVQVKIGENTVQIIVNERDKSIQTQLLLDAVQLHVHYDN